MTEAGGDDRPGRGRAAAVVAAIALVAAAVWLIWVRDPPRSVTPDELDEAIAAAVTTTRRPPADSREVYRTILPSMVFIQSTRTPANDPGSPAVSIGSGVIVNAAGHILTANHVVAGQSTLTVRFADGTEATASVLNRDRSRDIAVLVADRSPEVIVPAVIGGGARIGDDAFAVGNPLGLAGSISAGVISGLDRKVPIPNRNGDLEGLIQFDAAANPGSSGGPLLDRDGRVIGIVTALANPTGEDFFSGIGFAVPIGAAIGAGTGGDGPGF